LALEVCLGITSLKVLLTFYLAVARATMRYLGGVEHIPVYIPVVIFVSSCADLLMFERSFGIPKRGTLLNRRATS